MGAGARRQADSGLARLPGDMFQRDGSAPLYIEAYGAYGIANDPYFSSNRVSLFDRAFVVAIAHVRGGSELGQGWYEDGRLLNKRNTFRDFVDVADHLVREGYGAKDRVFAAGGSAGGLLMGAVAEMKDPGSVSWHRTARPVRRRRHDDA